MTYKEEQAQIKELEDLKRAMLRKQAFPRSVYDADGNHRVVMDEAGLTKAETDGFGVHPDSPVHGFGEAKPQTEEPTE